MHVLDDLRLWTVRQSWLPGSASSSGGSGTAVAGNAAITGTFDMLKITTISQKRKIGINSVKTKVDPRLKTLELRPFRSSPQPAFNYPARKATILANKMLASVAETGVWVVVLQAGWRGVMYADRLFTSLVVSMGVASTIMLVAVLFL